MPLLQQEIARRRTFAIAVKQDWIFAGYEFVASVGNCHRDLSAVERGGKAFFDGVGPRREPRHSHALNFFFDAGCDIEIVNDIRIDRGGKGIAQ